MADPRALRGTVARPPALASEPASIEIAAGAVRARIDGGDTVEIALSTIVLEPGGFDGDFVFCRPGDGSFTITISDPAFVDALRATGIASLEPQLAKVTKHRVSARRGAWISMGVAALLVGGALVLLWNVPNLLATSVGALPLAVDRRLGDAAYAEAGVGRRLEGTAASAMLEQIVARLAPHVGERGHDYRVDLVEDETENAFALPGGRIVVLTGLVRAAGSADEIAGVLAHEMAHVTRRHGVRNLAHRAGITLALRLLLGDVDGWTELAADGAAFARESAYSREQEAEADDDAVGTMSRAGLDPIALCGFLRRIQAEPGAAITDAASWLSSHPDTASRIAHVQRVAQALPASERQPLPVDWGAVQAEIDRDAR